jgi:hypothetical protein
MRIFSQWITAAAMVAGLLLATPAMAQPALLPVPSPAPGDGTILLTIFLKHDESRPLGKLNEQLREQGFYKAFPPQGIQVVSWYVLMGIGQVITLRVPAGRVREVNRVVEDTAWGAYRTEFFLTYDYKAIGEQTHALAVGR